MASAKPGVHIVQLKPVSVPKYMIDGEKFIKWEEETSTREAVTLKVDENGFFLYWVSPVKETDLVDIATIRDTRTGRSTRLPRDLKFRQQINYGSLDSLEDKTLTVVTGPDFVNLTFFTFSCENKTLAKQWSTDLLKLSTNLLQLNSPVMSFLKKIHTKLILLSDKEGKIQLKSIVKTFTSNKEDKKRVEKAVVDALVTGGGLDKETIPVEHFPFHPVFFNLYINLTSRSEVEIIFSKLGSNPTHLTAEEFMEFINREQRDPRLNEILYPYATPDKAKELIDNYEPLEDHKMKGWLSFGGFLRYILSEDNAVVSYEKYDLSDDMDQPLCHYFINSSHNTYLTGHQLTGKSSIEMYRQALLAGCRCVELDFWNGGRTEEPVIVHGYTLVPDIPAKDVIEAIAESAFKTSDYPVILSFENHCNPKQQAKIANYCREFFGDMLLEGVLEGFELTTGTPLPPPSLLKHKIIIKNKKKHHHHHHQKKPASAAAPTVVETPAAAVEDYSDSESESSSSEDSLLELNKETPSSDSGTAGKESEAGAEISALVNYVQPVHFYSFEASLARNKSYEMSSFDERQAMTLLKERPTEFVNYNKHQLSRVYPRGTRVDSANFMPQLFWNAGCQLVALNYQTLDLAMQLNMGIFELNRKCGFLLKPEFMRRKDRQLDPFAESTVDGIIAGCVGIRVISAQFLTTKTRTGSYVEAEMYGLPTDTIRKKFRTRLSTPSPPPLTTTSSITFDDDEFLFKKIVLPELALIRIVAYEDGGKPIGHRVIPVLGLRPGYRHIVLRNESGQPLSLPSAVFVHISVKDYVPDGLCDFAEALANPIKYQNELDKRSRQLEVLIGGETGDDDSPLHTNTNTTNNQSHSMDDPQPQLPPIPSSPLYTNQATTSSSASLPPPPPHLQSRTMSIKKKDTADSVCVSNPPPPLLLATYGVGGGSTTFQVETLEGVLNGKSVKEKMDGLKKKLEGLRKRGSSGGSTSGSAGGSRILVKKLSKIELNENQERDFVEKQVEEIHKSLQKHLTTTQQKQQRLLATLRDRQKNEIMKWIYSWRKDEYRRLSKQTRDKNELDRMKREVNNVLVAKGVAERERVEIEFNEIEGKLAKDWEALFKNVEVWRGRVAGELMMGGGSAAGGSCGSGAVLLSYIEK